MPGPVHSRRQFLVGAGAAIALPFLASLLPRSVWGEVSAVASPPTRLLFLCVPLGFAAKDAFLQAHGIRNDGWVPAEDGPSYRMPDVHACLEPWRREISFIKGLRHRRFRGDSHGSDDVFLTGADTFAEPTRSFTNSVSCDVVAAASSRLGAGVRHRSLSLGVPSASLRTSRSGGLSWTRDGLPITPLVSPAQVFDTLFGAHDLPATERLRRLQERRSVLDTTLEQQRRIVAQLAAADRHTFAAAVTAVRDVEVDIHREQQWLTVPALGTSPSRSQDANVPSGGRSLRAMFDLIHAAFLTDSTRVIAYHLPGCVTDLIGPTVGDKHDLVHGSTIAQAQGLVANDRLVSEHLAALLTMLDASRAADGHSLLHHTIGGVGAGSWGTWHDTSRLPLLLFGEGGGRVRQGAVRTAVDGMPLANVWLTMLRAAGVPIERFADSTGIVPDLLR